MPFKDRPRLVAKDPCTTKLYTDDLREVVHLAQREKRTVSDLIRELAHEALRDRRLRAIGRDERELLSKRDSSSEAEAIAAQVAQGQAELKELFAVLTVQQQAQWTLNGLTFEHQLATEKIAQILMMIGMQRDQLSGAEIQSQLAQLTAQTQQQAAQIRQAIAAKFTLSKAESEV
jgi:hypothetical protein